MAETEEFITRSGVASLKFRGVLLNVFFVAKIYKDEMNGYDVNVYDDVEVDRHIVYESHKRKLHIATDRLKLALEDQILEGTRRPRFAHIDWLDVPDAISWGE